MKLTEATEAETKLINKLSNEIKAKIEGWTDALSDIINASSWVRGSQLDQLYSALINVEDNLPG